MAQTKLLTGTEAAEQFQQAYDADIRKYQDANELTALRTMWNDYTDRLCKDGQITQWDYENIGPLFTKCECCGDVAIDFTLMEKFDEEREAHEKEERTYTFIVDLDERGEYKAHVENHEGTQVWAIDTEALQQAIDDGYLKHKDICMYAWCDYLKDTGVEWFDIEDPILVNAAGKGGMAKGL